MKASLMMLVLLGTAAGLSLEASRQRALTLKERPVSKVVALLQDMLKQLEKDATEDKEIYEKLACWCETNDREKTQSVASAQAHITDLTHSIEELTAKTGQLQTEVKNLEQEVAKNQEALDQATAIRQKQLAEFQAEERELTESISALKAAVAVLQKHQGASLLQLPTWQRRAVTEAARRLGRKEAVALLQGPSSYAPQSNEIFGVLEQMLATFQANLMSSQKEEGANQVAYEGLKAAKEAEIAAGRAQVDAKTQELASAGEKLAHSKEDLQDTRASLSADEQFLLTLKEKCQMTDKEWEQRQKTRHLEVEAVNKALTILTSDDAHDLLSRTFSPSFLQARRSTRTSRGKEASAILAAAARRLRKPELAALALRTKLDAFERVQAAIDGLVEQLLKEKADEIKHKDFCVSELHENELQTERKEREHRDQGAKVEDLEMTVKTLTEACELLKAEIAELQVQLKRAGEDRETENKEFQATVADQRETQKLLEAAISVLEEFYSSHKPAAFVQQEPAGPPPPAGFEAYKANAASGGVIAVLRQIISDAKSMEAETIRSEEDAQKAYEDFVRDTNAAVGAKTSGLTDKSENRAAAEGELVAAKEALGNSGLELEQLATSKAELHQSCDFVLKNFDLRQSARDEEVEALRQAKASLSGAKLK